MISLVLSLTFGILCYLGAFPLALPIFGMALGANALLKETRYRKRMAIIVTSIIALFINGLPTLTIILRSMGT